MIRALVPSTDGLSLQGAVSTIFFWETLIAENPPWDDLHKLAERGRKFLEKRRRIASQYRKKCKEKGIDSTILRIEKVDLDTIPAMAGIEGKTPNGMIVRILGLGLCWRRENLEGDIRGEILQEKTVKVLGVKTASELSKLLALEELPIPM